MKQGDLNSTVKLVCLAGLHATLSEVIHLQKLVLKEPQLWNGRNQVPSKRARVPMKEKIGRMAHRRMESGRGIKGESIIRHPQVPHLVSSDPPDRLPIVGYVEPFLEILSFIECWDKKIRIG